MRSKANDEYLEQTFQDNLKRIPPFLRINKVTIGVGIALVVVIIVVLAIVLITRTSMNSDDSLTIVEGAVNGTGYILIAGICIGIVLLWFVACYALEKSAYRKASEAALRMAQLEEEHIRRDYEPLLNTYIAPKEEKTRPDFCPECGEILLEDDSVCPKCGAKIQ